MTNKIVRTSTATTSSTTRAQLTKLKSLKNLQSKASDDDFGFSESGIVVAARLDDESPFFVEPPPLITNTHMATVPES